jgi:hypothetical protein
VQVNVEVDCDHREQEHMSPRIVSTAAGEVSGTVRVVAR